MTVWPAIELGVNIDHVATLRRVRGTSYPDPVYAAFLAEEAGAAGITIHLREDRRHIQDRDLELLLKTVRGRLNLEMAGTEAMLAIAERARPSNCCLVPERRAELTTEGGLDVASEVPRWTTINRRLAAVGIEVSLFVDPTLVQIEASARAGVPAIELHTGRYAEAVDEPARALELERIERAAERAQALGLRVNAGHGIHYSNVQEIARIRPIVELNIGHAIVAQAVFTGFPAAVREMKRLMTEARR